MRQVIVCLSCPPYGLGKAAKETFQIPPLGHVDYLGAAAGFQKGGIGAHALPCFPHPGRKNGGGNVAEGESNNSSKIWLRRENKYK